MAKKKTTRKKTTGKTSTRTGAPDHIRNRLQKLRRALKGRGFDGMLITNCADVRYLTGSLGHDTYLLIAGRAAYVFSDFRYEEDLAPLKSWAKVVMRESTLAQAVADVTGDLKLKKIAVQAEYLKVQERGGLARAIGKSKVRDTIGILASLRVIKDDTEIRLIRKAIKVAQQGLDATLQTLKSGQTEREICARLEYEMKMRGAEEAAFAPIIAARTNGSRPHYSPSEKVKLGKGQPLLIDWGARVDGYVSDLTRTFGFGKMPAKVTEIYKIVLDAQLTAIAAIKPGVELRAVDKAARDVISKAGYGDRFGHGLGHGIGLDVHEAPGMGQRAKKGDRLQAGMVVTVEPGIYLPGIGGVRIEDDVLVTEKGRRILSNFPKDIGSTLI